MTEAEFHAFIDGCLPPDRAAAVAAEVEASPALQARLAGYAADRDALRRALGVVAAAPIPRHLAAAAAPPAAAARPPRRALLAAGGLAIAASLLGVWVLDTGRDPLVEAALDARTADGQPIEAVLLPALLGGRVRVPDLRRAGYSLAGIAAYPTGVQLRFTGAGRPDFTLFLAKSRGADRFALLERRHLRVCVWENDEISAVMAADLPKSVLFRLASLTYSALNA